MAKKGHRAHGDGSYYQVKRTGKWKAAVTIGYYPNGAAKRTTRSFPNEDAARAGLNEMLVEQQHGTLAPPDKLTVKEYLETWLKDVVKPSVRPTTYSSYESSMRLHIIQHIGRSNLAKLQALEVQRLINRNAANLAPSSLARVLNIFSGALNQALKWKLIQYNVATLVSMPRQVRREVKALTPEQSRKLLDTAIGNRCEALYRLALNTGMRRGEILGLRWQDVDLAKGTLTVRGQLLALPGGQRWVEPKTERSKRTLVLPAGMITALHAHRARQLAERAKAGAGWQETSYVFTKEDGTPIRPEWLCRDCKALLKKAELPPIVFHGLRHSAASLLLADGVPPVDVAAMMGHTVDMLLRTYGHALVEGQREVARRMDYLLGEQKTN